MDRQISIIIPVFNAEIYLRHCLDSVTNQTYDNIEIICVDDGSTDASFQILTEYAKNDGRLKIHKRNHSGVANTRNYAISIARCCYLMFVDADDWLENNACEIVISLFEKYNPDIVMFSYFREYQKKSIQKDIFNEDIIFYNDTACKQLHRRHAGIIDEELRRPENADALCSLCTKAYKTSYIQDNDIQCIDNTIIGTYEDGIFNLFYFKYVKQAVYINKSLYHYRKTNLNSIVTTYKPDLKNQWNNMYDIIEKYITEHSLDSKYSQGLENRIALSILGLGLNELGSNNNIIIKIKNINDVLKQKRTRKALKQLKISIMPIHWKVFFACAKMQFALGVYLMLAAVKILKEKI